MTTTEQKADYVKQVVVHDGKHHCHWPGCNKAVPPAMWGCKAHWFKLPAGLRSQIWATYKPGQEISKTPSAEYIAVAKRVQEWIESYNAELRREP